MTKTEPSIHLYEGRPYVHSIHQQTGGILRRSHNNADSILGRWLLERSSQAEPQDAEQYERDQIAEHVGMQQRAYR